MNMGMDRWGFLCSVVSSPIVYFLTTTRAVCPNINLIMLCTHVCDGNYAACYSCSSSAQLNFHKFVRYSRVANFHIDLRSLFSVKSAQFVRSSSP